MSWKRDIQDWIYTRHDSPTQNQFKKTEKVAIRGGWNPQKYKSSMRRSLHKWLTEWYTLSIKKLPEPATARRNPIKLNNFKKLRRLGISRTKIRKILKISANVVLKLERGDKFLTKRQEKLIKKWLKGHNVRKFN